MIYPITQPQISAKDLHCILQMPGALQLLILGLALKTLEIWQKDLIFITQSPDGIPGWPKKLQITLQKDPQIYFLRMKGRMIGLQL